MLEKSKEFMSNLKRTEKFICKTEDSALKIPQMITAQWISV
jgi:hypothetical protein